MPKDVVESGASRVLKEDAGCKKQHGCMGEEGDKRAEVTGNSPSCG